MPEYNTIFEELGGEDSACLRHLRASAMDKSEIYAFLQSGSPGHAAEVLDSLLSRIGDQQLKSSLLRLYIITDIHFAAKSFAESMGVPQEIFVEMCGSVDAVIKQFNTLESVKRYLTDILEKCIDLRRMALSHEVDSAIEKAKTYIAENFYDAEMSLERVAAAVNVSAAYFSSIFKKEAGESFVSYVTSVRMQKAKELLCCSSKKISEVAHGVGYNDYHYFSSLFKKVTGQSPSKFRQLNNRSSVDEP